MKDRFMEFPLNKKIAWITGTLSTLIVIIAAFWTLHCRYDNTVIASELKQIKNKAIMTDIRLERKILYDHKKDINQEIRQIKWSEENRSGQCVDCEQQIQELEEQKADIDKELDVIIKELKIREIGD